MLRGLGAAGLAGALAGCGGGDGGEGSSGSDDSAGEGDDSGGVPAEVETYLEDADNFDGTLEDATGQSEVSVRVGSEANGGNFGFSPPAVRVDAGTTVVWEWTGKGGSHNVVEEQGAFESELVDEQGHTFEQAVDESGVTLYNCTPHLGVGMLGAIVVE